MCILFYIFYMKAMHYLIRFTNNLYWKGGLTLKHTYHFHYFYIIQNIIWRNTGSIIWATWKVYLVLSSRMQSLLCSITSLGNCNVFINSTEGTIYYPLICILHNQLQNTISTIHCITTWCVLKYMAGCFSPWSVNALNGKG